jgi:NitT/TauT family transport system substrate-binding protein
MKKYFSLVLGIIILLILIFCYLPINKEEDKTSVKVAEVTHSPFYAPFYTAIENGYFKDEGIDIDLTLVSGADKVAASVLSDDVDIGFAGPEATIYIYESGNTDYLVTFAGLTKRDGQFIVGRTNEEFSLEDLYGKEILVGRQGGMPALNFLNALKKQNIDYSKININYSIDFASLSGSFIGGIGDYVNLFEPTATKVVNEGYGYVLLSIGQYSGQMPYTAYFAKKSFIDNNNDLIKKFNKALNKGLEFVKENDSSVIAQVIKNQFIDSSIEDLTLYIERYKLYDCWLDNTYISEESYKNLEDIMIDNNLLDNYVPYNKLVINE